MTATAWFRHSSPSSIAPDAAEVISGSYDEEHDSCPAIHRGSVASFACNRREAHLGRHLALGARLTVVAAWPGGHAPTVADLRAEAAS